MKKFLIALITAFLVLLNVRLWGVRDAAMLIPERASWRHATCDMPYGQLCDPNYQAEQEMLQEQLCGGYTDRGQMAVCLAKVAAYIRHKAMIEEQKMHQEPCCMSYPEAQSIFNQALHQFAGRPHCNELTLQQLINLADAELRLIEVLVYPTMGNRHECIQERNDLLQKAIPSVQMMYDKLLSVATHNDMLNEQYATSEGRPNFALDFDDRRIFLHTMYQRIADMKQKIKDMQYRIAMAALN